MVPLPSGPDVTFPYDTAKEKIYIGNVSAQSPFSSIWLLPVIS